MDGLSFYRNRQGEYMVRKPGGPDRTRILTDPGFVRTRENMSEFAGLAMATSSLSHVFAPVKHLRDTGLRGRAAKLFRSMMKRDGSLRGQRQVLLSQYREELLNMELNIETPFKEVFRGKYTTTHGPDRKLGSVTINNLQPSISVQAPREATHFQLVLLTGVLADTVYNTELNRYECIYPTLDGEYTVTTSEQFSVTDTETLSIYLDSVLNVIELPENTTVVQALGISFFRKELALFYPLNQGKSMKIVDVY